MPLHLKVKAPFCNYDVIISHDKQRPTKIDLRADNGDTWNSPEGQGRNLNLGAIIVKQ